MDCVLDYARRRLNTREEPPSALGQWADIPGPADALNFSKARASPSVILTRADLFLFLRNDCHRVCWRRYLYRPHMPLPWMMGADGANRFQ